MYIFLFLVGVICGYSTNLERSSGQKTEQNFVHDRLKKAKKGDYIVAELNKLTLLLHIHSISSDRLLLEEISIPSHALKAHPSSWKEWVQAKAPGHTSWSMTEIHLETGEVLSCFSFSKAAWVDIADNESLFASLLQLPIHLVAPDARRRIGSPPGPEESDFRKIWHPPMIFEGVKRENTAFHAFETSWPQDGSELSGKKIVLYFDNSIHFPLPLWVQIEASHIVGNLRAIDSGRGMVSPFRSLPKH